MTLRVRVSVVAWHVYHTHHGWGWLPGQHGTGVVAVSVSLFTCVCVCEFLCKGVCVCVCVRVHVCVHLAKVGLTEHLFKALFLCTRGLYFFSQHWWPVLGISYFAKQPGWLVLGIAFVMVQLI